ncbi:MAG TPA: hypothetical protein VN222_02890 [Novosphingobium sp.]|nr:hypothetical protein [Novosphingobium sp.]
MKMGKTGLVLSGILAGALATGAAFGAVSAAQDAKADAALKIIWAKEMSIYAGRGQGKLDFYVNNASPHYMAWVAGTPAPFKLDALRAAAPSLAGHAQEKISTELKGFTLSGTTAVIYYLNHRTVTSTGQPVNQYYANIHVWVKEGGDWKVIGSMSRLIDPPKG